MEKTDKKQNVRRIEYWLHKIKGGIQYQPTLRSEQSIKVLAEDIVDSLDIASESTLDHKAQEMLNKINLLHANQQLLSEENLTALLVLEKELKTIKKWGKVSGVLTVLVLIATLTFGILRLL